MRIIAKKSFPKALQVIDRFHLQKLALEALQDVRIKYRWDAIDLENEQVNRQEQRTKHSLQRNLAMETQESNYWQ